VARGNPRLLVSVGLAIVALGMSLGSLAPSLPLFLAAMGIGGGIGLGFTGMTTHAALIADAYVRRRGLATGIAFGGSMAAYALAPPVQWLITRWGWRTALCCYAGAIVAVIPWAWRAHPARLGSRGGSPGGSSGTTVTVVQIVRSAGFWSLLVMFTTPPLFGYLATTQHTLYFIARGFTADQASLLLGVGGVLAGCGRALAGLVADRFGGPTAGFLSFSCSLLGMLCLIGMEVRPLWLLAAGYIFFLFLPLGSRASIVSVLLGRLAPSAHYGVIFGLLGIGNNLGAATGPWLSGLLFDRSGSYLVIYLWAVGIALAGLASLTVFTLVTRPPGQ
jgi:predicted MFS family arabinose efflux permease